MKLATTIVAASALTSFTMAAPVLDMFYPKAGEMTSEARAIWGDYRDVKRNNIIDNLEEHDPLDNRDDLSTFEKRQYSEAWDRYFGSGDNNLDPTTFGKRRLERRQAMKRGFFDGEDLEKDLGLNSRDVQDSEPFNYILGLQRRNWVSIMMDKIHKTQRGDDSPLVDGLYEVAKRDVDDSAKEDILSRVLDPLHRHAWSMGKRDTIQGFLHDLAGSAMVDRKRDVSDSGEEPDLAETAFDPLAGFSAREWMNRLGDVFGGLGERDVDDSSEPSAETLRKRYSFWEELKLGFEMMARRDAEDGSAKLSASKRDYPTPHVDDIVERAVEMKRDNDEPQEFVMGPDGKLEYNMDYVFKHGFFVKKRSVGEDQAENDLEKRWNCWQLSSHC